MESTGHRTWTLTTRRPRRCCGCDPSTLSEWAETVSSSAKGPRRSACVTSPCSATPAAAFSAARALWAAGWTPSRPCTCPTCRARSRPGRGCAPRWRLAGWCSRGRGPEPSTAWPRERQRAPLQAPGAPGRRAGRRSVRDSGAVAAVRLPIGQRRAGPKPSHPPRLLGGRALCRGGTRLGRCDAELRGQRVGGSRNPARGHVHPACLRRPVAPGHRGRARGARARLRPRRIHRGAPVRSVSRAGGAGV